MSQLDASNLFLPIGSNWNEHSASYATTVTGAFSTAAASAGLAAWVSALNIGNSVTVAIRHDVMMIGLRPILSLSQPKKTKVGVEMMSAMTSRLLAVAPSTLADRKSTRLNSSH